MKECDFVRVAFYTLGCKVNQYETITLSESFIKDGFEIVNHADDADVYVLNSCTVTGEADKKSRQLLRRFRRQNPSAIVALCGCFPQAFPEDSAATTEADIVLGTSNKNELLANVKEVMAEGGRIVKIKSHSKDETFDNSRVLHFGDKTRAFIKIQDGCERYCAYCIIPFARGPVRSKQLKELKEEISSLGKNGYKEIVLVGINLSCYGTDIGLHLLDAIKAACSVEEIQRVRLGSLEPELLSAEIISQMSTEPKFCPQFHLSLQSGSDATLKRMRRHYTTSEYMEIVSNLRSSFKNAAITTDIMVGFPGETDAEFSDAMNFIENLGLARAHVFAYSRRAGTTADKMENQIDNSVKSFRSKAMLKLTNHSRFEFLNSQIGLTESVLFETKTPKGWEGYTMNYTPVLVSSDEDLSAQIRSVKLISHDDENCCGELV